MEKDATKRILQVIRENQKLDNDKEIEKLIEGTEVSKHKNFLTEFKELVKKYEKKNLNEEVVSSADGNSESDSMKITKNTPQFGDIRVSQEESVKKTIGECIEMGEDALVYYPNRKDLVLTGKINSLNIVFQFKYNDPSGDGCYVWANGLQLTETNSRTLGKIRDAFVNWKNSLIENSDILEKLQKASEKK